MFGSGGGSEQLQNVRSLVATQSDSHATAALVDAKPFVVRPFALQLLTSLCSGSLAGLAFGVSDVVRATSALGGSLELPIAAALLGLWLWVGQVLGLFVWLIRILAAAVERRMPSRIACHCLWALLTGGLALLVARRVFSGAGIRATYVGSWGPWVAPLCVGVGTLCVVRQLEPVRESQPKWVLAGSVAVLSVFAVVVDAYSPGGMLYLHVLLLAVGLALALHAVDWAKLPHFAGYTTLALSLLTLPNLLAFPSTRLARELLAQSDWAGWEIIDYIQFHFDLDHDGYSPLFGGGDCDDADPSVFSGATERPGDGHDSDCDGIDDPTPSGLVFAPFQPQSEQPARQVSERARQFPTVVILVDALRFDRVENARTPNLARLANESIRFTHAYSTSSTTLTSVQAMMSGRVRPALGRQNIAQSLARAGQASCFVAPDVLIDHFQKLGESNPLLSFSARDAIFTHHAISWGPGNTVSTSDQVTAEAIKLLDATTPPALLWLHYFDVHEWNVIEGEGLSAHGDIARYDAAVARFDASLRPLLERRERVNLVLIADHGEGLGARGIKNHANFMIQELTRIPLLIRVPGSDPARVDTAVTSTAVFNTLRALRGLELDPTADQSLLTLVGMSGLGEGPGFPGFDNAQWSFLYGNHRLLYMPHQQLVELYDVERDPLETKNQASESPHLAAELLARLFLVHNEPPQ
ncbi:MAG: sulfatase-like hydrolase/transferase [Myxococcales bacterium]